MNFTPKAPCHGCPDRKAGCHGQCPKYKEYRIYMDEQARLRKIAVSAIPANYGVANKRIGNKKVKTGKIE